MARAIDGLGVARGVYAVFLAVIGAVLAAGGIRLFLLGGSAYYVLAGITLIATAVLVWRRDARGPLAYGGFLAATLAWAVWECGLDAWALSARLTAPAVLGLPFLLPMLRDKRPLSLAAALCAPVILVLVIGRLGLGSIDLAKPSPPPPSRQGGRADADGEWRAWGRDAGGTRFSPLSDINTGDVAKLRAAWTYHVGRPTDGKLGNLEVTPLKVGDRLFVCNNMSMVDALDPETGRRLWRFDPHISVKGVVQRACRGVAYVDVGAGACPQRIIAATLDAKLWALDARTGAPCGDFGVHGVVDLGRGMGPIPPGSYYVTSAPTVARGNVVVGGWVIDGQKLGSPPGVTRAFDATTGAFAWAFDPARPDDHAEPAAGRTYVLGTPNSWAPMSADDGLGLVYGAMGNAGPDYFGAHRSPAMERYASAIVALDAATGAVRWSFQMVHHDLWDYDGAAQPTLIDLPGSRGVSTPALVQTGKSGQIFLLDRRDGRPLSPIEERPAPQGPAPLERLSPTQPVSPGLPSVTGPRLTEARMWGLTPLDQLWCRIAFREARYDGEYTPPQLGRGSLEYPGFMGAVSWGGVSIDRVHGYAIVNSTEVPTHHRLIPRAEADALGLKPQGSPGATPHPGYLPQAGTPYAEEGRGFLSPLGAPCSQPPYGRLTAVDLATHKVAWSRPLGSARDSGVFGLRLGLPLAMGVPNTGGSISTAGGLAFIAATQEESLRAVDTATGRVLWSARLPAGGQATPMTYRSSASGRQFVVVAAGGKALLHTRLGDSLVAFALPGPGAKP